MISINIGIFFVQVISGLALFSGCVGSPPSLNMVSTLLTFLLELLQFLLLRHSFRPCGSRLFVFLTR